MKKNNLVPILIVSLTINVLLVGLIGYSKRSAIKGCLTELIQTKTDDTEEQLLAFNNVVTPLYVDTCNNKAGTPFNLLVIGNSISYHMVVEEMGWKQAGGMAASSTDKDFAHVLFKRMEEILPEKAIRLRVSNLCGFERHPEALDVTKLDSLLLYKPDLIVFQLGENAGKNDQAHLSVFENNYIELINSFKEKGNPLVVCTTPFFPSLPMNEIIEQVALSTNSYLVDLSHLTLLETGNYAKNEANYLGDKSAWKEKGIGIHPGDRGMENIAEQLFITINAALSRAKN